MQTAQMIALLSQANGATENAERLLHAAKRQLEEARAAIMVVRNVSVDPLGLPALEQMLQNIERALVEARRVTDANDAYMQQI